MAKKEAAVSEPMPVMPDKYSEYRVEDAVRTLMQAEEIKQDPKMMALVAKKLDKQQLAIKSIADLKKAGATPVDDNDAEDMTEGDE